jgi:BNR repeat-like domain
MDGMRRTLTIVAAALVALTAAAMDGSAGPAATQDPKEIARQLLDSDAGKLLTSNARLALEAAVRGDRQLGTDLAGGAKGTGNTDAAGFREAQGGGDPGQPEFRNVRVNNPADDTQQIDQTTQSETSIAVVGSDIAVGFNDSQNTLPFFTQATNLSGFAFSHDGGKSFTDGGVIPNKAGCVNFGDPWLTSDRTGAMYYSTLAFCLAPGRFTLEVGVAKSTDGGRTFRAPVIATRSTGSVFYSSDKDAITAGPDPRVQRDNLYDAYDDFAGVFDPRTGFQILHGLGVSRSTDGGATWQVSYANRIPLFSRCSFTQYIGAMPLVDPSNGTLYVAAQKFFQGFAAAGCPPPTPLTRSEVLFVSKDGGATFGPERLIATVNKSIPSPGFFSFLNLGDAKLMRLLELPTLAITGDGLFASWQEGLGGHAHIRLARSSDGGTTWTVSTVTSGTGDEVQPAMSGDASGLHILYFQRNRDNTLDVKVSNSSDAGATFDTRRVTTESFPGVFTFPQFDPIIAFGYMGDYIANVSDGTNQFFAWGDNRDIVRDFFWPQGRNDPDVFFAAQTQ